MLPSQLLIARVKGGFIFPKYAYFRQRYILLASELIELFKKSVGRKRKILLDKINELEEKAFRNGFDYRFARGLIHILLRKTIFDKGDVKVDSLKARLEVFYEVNRVYNGFVLNEEERNRVFKKVAGKLNITVPELIKSFYSTYEEEDTVKEFKPISPIELLKQYNLSLTQTLLFKALNMTINFIATGAEVKILLYNAKRLGLMYMADQIDENTVRLNIDGPASILRQTQRYGTRLAKLIPYIFSTRKWSIKARVERKSGRKYLFYISDRYRFLFPQIDIRMEEYDSMVEMTFYKRFKTLGSGWNIFREPEPIIVNRKIFIPDFSFTKNGLKVYLEIVGFWTPEYLRRKLQKLSQLKNINIIIAVNENLSCAKLFKKLPHEVILFRDKLPTPEVYLRLKKYFPEKKVKSRLSKKKMIVIPKEFKEYLSKIDECLLKDVLNEGKKYGLKNDDILDILNKMNFKMDWKTIDINSVKIYRRRDKND